MDQQTRDEYVVSSMLKFVQDPLEHIHANPEEYLTQMQTLLLLSVQMTLVQVNELLPEPIQQQVYAILALVEKMNKSGDIVLLDGVRAVDRWPLELAEALLEGATPWVNHPENAPTRHKDFYDIANCVNYSLRHPIGEIDWRDPCYDEQFFEHRSTYTTQELLDALVLLSQGIRMSDERISNYEPQIRQVLQEVVRRVHSATPPIFVPITVLENGKKGS